MDLLLHKVTQQAVQYAIRSGITITSAYCIKECGRLLKQAPKSRERHELLQLQLRLSQKIRMLATPIDMIELIAARGNTCLDSALSLCRDLRYDIQALGQRLDKAAHQEQRLRQHTSNGASREDADHELVAIISQVKLLIARIDDAVPMINLAITTSGVSLSTKLSGTISPSRLMQASTFLTAADTSFASLPTTHHQIGPTYTCCLFMLFAGHATRGAGHETTWKEVIHKARVKLWRVPLEKLYDLPGDSSKPDVYDAGTIRSDNKAAEFAYQLSIVEDMDDSRVHTIEQNRPQPGPFDDVPNAGIRDIVPIHEISKIFYADSGKFLGIRGDDEIVHPCLLIKRDVHAEPPRRMARTSHAQSTSTSPSLDDEGEDDQSQIDAQIQRESTSEMPIEEEAMPCAQSWRLPPDVDPEWLGLQVFVEDQDSESEDDELELELERPQSSHCASFEPSLASAVSDLNISLSRAGTPVKSLSKLTLSPEKSAGPPIKTTLSLLEMLLKLSALQQFRQESHLAIEDELLNFFLEDSGTAGASEKHHRQEIRHAAIQRVGFDPYDESPIKRRGEEYIRGTDGSPRSVRNSPARTGIPYDENYEHGLQTPSLDFSRPTIEHFSPDRAVAYSPSPRPIVYQQTPSRSSTPDTTSYAHRSAVQAKSEAWRPIASSEGLATPPSAQKIRAASLRTQSATEARSPLRETHASEEDVM